MGREKTSNSTEQRMEKMNSRGFYELLLWIQTYRVQFMKGSLWAIRLEPFLHQQVCVSPPKVKDTSRNNRTIAFHPDVLPKTCSLRWLDIRSTGSSTTPLVMWSICFGKEIESHFAHEVIYIDSQCIPQGQLCTTSIVFRLALNFPLFTARSTNDSEI